MSGPPPRPGSISESLQQRLAAIAAQVVPPESTGPGDPDPLAGVSIDELKRILGDRSRPTHLRIAAIDHLGRRLRTELELGPTLQDVWADPDEAVALAAIRTAPPFDAGVRDALRALLDDPRPAFRAEAAELLARRKDPVALETLLRWVESGDADRYELALDGLAILLAPAELVELLAEQLAHRADDEIRTVLAAAGLLRIGDERGLDRLRAAAVGGGDRAAARAIEAVLDRAEPLGLELAAARLAAGDDGHDLLLAGLSRRFGFEPGGPGDKLGRARTWVGQRLAVLRSQRSISGSEACL